MKFHGEMICGKKIYLMKIISIILFSACIALCFLLNMYFFFIFLAFFIYLWLIFKYPEVALFVAVLGICNFFSLMNEDFLRVPYVFRIRDVFLLSTFLPLLGGIYKRDEKIKRVFMNPIATGIYLILLLCFIQVFLTKLRFPDESFSSLIRAGRRYFYYAIFFPALYILLDKNRLKRFIKLFIVSVIIFCSMFIIQFYMGPTYKIFLSARVEHQILQGFGVTRLYIDGAIVGAFIFQISFMIFLFYKKFQYRLKNLFITVLCGLQTFLTFGRAHIFGVVIGTLFGIACAKKQSKLRNLFKVFIVCFVILLLGEIVSKVFFTQKEDFLKGIFSRISSTYESVIHQEDTFYYRINDSLGRMQLIKKNPVFGIGFVHMDSGLFTLERGHDYELRTGDSGAITLLLDFGILGFVWLFTMAFIVLRRSIYIYMKTDSQFYKSIILGIIAFYFGRLFSFITLANFVRYDGIVITSLSLVLLEVINYQLSECNSEQ